MEAEKLCKQLEALCKDGISNPNSNTSSTGGAGETSPGGPHSKRHTFIRRRTLSKYATVREEKIYLCNHIADSLANLPPKNPDVLSLALDTVLACCNDSDANTRLAAEEVLNRVLQEHIAAHPVTVLVDLFKHVKKNDDARCVVAAWSRFAHFAVYIRPQRFRCRAFVLNLIPCIFQLCRREEDLIHESLSEGLPLVLKALGPFVTETEIRSMIRAFLPNLSSDSSVKRRTAAASVVELCLQSRKADHAVEWLLRGLLGLIRSSADNASSASFCGILLAIKNALAAGSENGGGQQPTYHNLPLPMQIQILRTLLDCCSNSDHNVQGFSLETLHTFLRRLSLPMKDILCRMGGLANYQNSPGDSGDSFEFGGEENTSPDTDTPDVKDSQTLDPENFGSVDNPMLARKRTSIDASNDRSDTVSVISSAMSEDVTGSRHLDSVGDAQESGDDDDSPSTGLADTSFSDAAFTDRDLDGGQCDGSMGSDEHLDDGAFTMLGSLFDVNRAAVEYIARFISSKFLLRDGGTLPQIRPTIRVSVQSMALSCLTDLITFEPSLLFQPRFVMMDDDTVPDVLIADACIFLEHADPLLKAHGAVLSCLLCSATANPLLTIPHDLSFEVEPALRKTAGILRQESAAACRLAVEALEKCMEVFLFTEESVGLALDIFWEVVALLVDPKISYWLLKTELLWFLRAVPLTHLLYAETVCRSGIRDRRKGNLKDTVLQCLLGYLSHDDHRLRQAAAETLCWMPFSLGLPVLVSLQTYTFLRTSYEKHSKSVRNDLMHSIQTGLCFPYNAHEFPRFTSGIEDSVGLIIGQLFDALIGSTKKDHRAGVIYCLCLLSRIYPTSSYSRSWFGVIEDSDLSMERYTSPAVGLLSRILESLTSTSYASDLQLHAHAMELIGNLFAGISMAVSSVRGKTDGVAWNHLGCHGLRLFADALARHIARLLHIVKAVSEGQKTADVFSSGKSLALLSASPGSTLSLRRRNDSVKRGDKKTKLASLDLRGKTQLGTLTSMDVYGAVMEAVKKALNRRRTHLCDLNSDRFYHLVKSTVTCLAQLLEMTASDFMSPHTDEMMRYLRVTIDVEGQTSVYCVEQLLRCLFGCNLAQMDSAAFVRDTRVHFIPLPPASELLVAFAEESPLGSFLPRFMTSTAQLSSAFDNEEWSRRWSVSLETHRIECLEALFKSYTKEKKVIMSETIRQFETVVIKSLQLYTCTVECGAQVQVLDLLVLLLQLHVNYNVLDGEHTFLKYILKQLELLEMGQIATSQKLLVYLFRFLIHLSHDKVIFQQNILTYGHIMQYCDSLMAIQAPSQKLVLPILRLLFDDAVQRRTGLSITGPDERDAQMEVILSTALRCLPEPSAIDIVQRFLMHQLAKSAGLYESLVRDLVDTTFQRILPASLDSTMCLRSFGKDYDKISSFLSIVGCHELLESQSFRRFFSELIAEVRKPSENNIAALLFFSATIDQFVSKGVIEPVLKLFHVSDQNHPLADPLEHNTEASAQGFAAVITQIFDALFESNTSTGLDSTQQQMLDFIYCSLLRTLTTFVQIVDQGPVKMTLREIQSTNRLDHSERQHINTACRLAWLQFRYAATGCDLEPRFWNKGIKLPIEDHICEVVWTIVRPERIGLIEPEESRRLISDLVKEDASSMELAILHQAHGFNALEFIQALLVSCRADEDEILLRWLLQLYGQPNGLALSLDLAEDLSRLTAAQTSPENQRGLLGAEDLERVRTAWVDEKTSELKRTISVLLGTPSTLKRSERDDLQQSDAWLQTLARTVTLESEVDDAPCIAQLLSTFDEETVMTIVTDQRFSSTLLRDCLRQVGGGVTLGWTMAPQKLTALFHAARFALLQGIGSFVAVDGGMGEGVDEWTWLMLATAFVEFGERLNHLEGDFPMDSMDDIFRLILLGFQSLPRCVNPALIRRRVLQCLLLCLENTSFISWLRDQSEAMVHDLVSHTAQTLVPPRSALSTLEDSRGDEDTREEMEVSQPLSPLHQHITQLAALLEDSHNSITELEAGVILGLSRLPMVAEVVRIPPSAYPLGWTCQQPAIPIELLQELPILKEFTSRVCRYGWTSRRQFEETWMAFLSVLSSVPIEEESEADAEQHEQTVTSRIAAGRVALRCITALLLESVLAPRPGNPLRQRGASSSVRSPHHQLDDFSALISSRKTVAVTDEWVTHFLCRPRRASYFHYRHFDGLDQLYCRWIMKGSPQSGSDSQVDLRSCLKFVMDLYSHWTSDERLKKLSPYILDEVVKSTLHISNIFHEEKNFRWMYLFVRQVLRIKNVEESLFYGHLIDALGKAVSAMDEDKEAMVTLRKTAETRATQSLMNRVSSSRMLLRLIRRQTPGEAQKSMQWLQNLSTTIYESECRSRVRSADALDLLFTIFVSQIDLFTSKSKESINPFSEVLLLELRGASSLSFPMLNNLILVLGRYLVDKRMEDGIFREQLVKTGLEVMNLPPPRSLTVFGLVLTCLDPEMRGSSQTDIQPEDNSPSIADSHSDPLFVMAMEKMATVQQRRNKSFSVETELLGTLYLRLLVDKTPLRETINRVMAEFQSCPASRAPAVADLVAKIFYLMKKHRLDDVVEEWIALSLGNFANRSPAGLGIWSLTCLFCASSSGSLSTLFPFLRLRFGVYDDVLHSIFIHSGLSFLQECESEETGKIFLNAVKAAVSTSDTMEEFHQKLVATSEEP